MGTPLEQLGVKGAVRHLEVLDATTEGKELEADFDPQGRCTYWNTTGVEEESLMAPARRSVTSGWMNTPAAYRYEYLSNGRVCLCVRRYISEISRNITDSTGMYPILKPVSQTGFRCPVRKQSEPSGFLLPPGIPFDGPLPSPIRIR